MSDPAGTSLTPLLPIYAALVPAFALMVTTLYNSYIVKVIKRTELNISDIKEKINELNKINNDIREKFDQKIEYKSDKYEDYKQAFMDKKRHLDALNFMKAFEYQNMFINKNYLFTQPIATNAIITGKEIKEKIDNFNIILVDGIKSVFDGSQKDVSTDEKYKILYNYITSIELSQRCEKIIMDQMSEYTRLYRHYLSKI